ncbi:MAG: hypothetical protein ABIZ70_02975 [Gemmatimonadales bacterium]
MFRTLPIFLLALATTRSIAQAPEIPATRLVGGVTLLEHRADAFARAPKLTVDPKPLLVIGGAGVDPDYGLEHVYQPVVLSDGRIAAFPWIGNSLRIFNAKGAPEKLIGKQGNGPGDFMRTTGLLLLPGDTLFTVDEANFRANWITVGKGVVRSAALLSDIRKTYNLTAIGALPGSRIVWASNLISSTPLPVGERLRRRKPFLVSSPLRDQIAFVDSIPGIEVAGFRTAYRGRKDSTALMVRLGMNSVLAVWGSGIAIANLTGEYAIERRSPTGSVIGRITVPVARRPVTTAMRDAVIAMDLARIDASGGEHMVDIGETRRQARESPFADSLPPIQGLFATPDNTLWAVDGLSYQTGTYWDATAFRIDGAIIGRLHFTGGGVPVYFGNNSVMVRSVDDDGIVTMTSYRIVATK